MSNDYIKVKGVAGLVRDPHSNAILNTDPAVLMKRKQKMIAEQKEKALEDKINSLEKDLSEIKDLLRKLVS